MGFLTNDRRQKTQNSTALAKPETLVRKVRNAPANTICASPSFSGNIPEFRTGRCTVEDPDDVKNRPLDTACLGNDTGRDQSRSWIQGNEAVLRACQHLQAVAICNSITLLLT